jgi:hypothetical protein
VITDDEIQELPTDDPEMAFVRFEEIVRDRSQEAISRCGNDSATEYELEYMNKVIGAAQHFGIEMLGETTLPKWGDQDVYWRYRQLLADVDKFTVQVRLRHFGEAKRFSVALSAAAKTKIHHFIGKIRDAITALDVSQEKRDELLAKSRTHYQDFCAALMAFWNAVEPGRKWLDSIAGVMAEARALEDATPPALPKVKPKLQITANMAKPKESFSADLDDEIPF